MKMNMNKSAVMMLAAAGLLTFNAPTAKAGSGSNAYVQVNLVSDGATNAAHTDPRLVNPWGIVAGPDAVWVNDNGPGLTTAYRPSGKPSEFAIFIPPPAGSSNSAGTPSGLIFNQTRKFVITNGSNQAPSTFLMSTEDGTIAAWNRSISGSNAIIVVDNSTNGAVYKGLAIAHDSNGAPQLYAANFHAGTVDVFDANFQPVQSFTDTNLPALFAPFNIKNIRGYLFVTFAKQKLPDMHDDDAGPGNGFVDIFGTDGTLLRSFAANGVLNSPWGMAVAPGNFGKFSHALLIGNFGDGTINAFSFLTGQTLGNLTQADGTSIVINGLWGLAFERDEDSDHDCEFAADRLYFAAGLNSEADGLLGYIHVAKDHSSHGEGEGNGQGENENENGNGSGQNGHTNSTVRVQAPTRSR